jgi:flavorubredoxin
MYLRELKTGIVCVGVVDWDRRLFDELISLPDGTSYNSYLIRGSEKTALIDTVDSSMPHALIENLDRSGAKSIDYVITHHAEQDHSGALPVVLEKYPAAKTVCTPKCREMLIDLGLAPADRIIVVSDRETLSLGDRTLEFIHTPWVHWPETMVTFLREDRILFSCDFLGSHQATTDLFVADEGKTYEASKRYYAEIMMPFRTAVRKNLEKVRQLPVDIIAPSHGPVHAKPQFICNAYDDWTSEVVKNEVVIPYVSMHGSIKLAVDHFVAGLVKRGVTVKQFKLSATDIGELASSLVDAATVVIATPTVLAGPHPLALYAASLANALRPKTKFVSIITSYGWGGKAVETLAAAIPNINAEVLQPVAIKGVPKADDYRALDALADEIAKRHKSL